jgi:hypothetical protein
MRTEVFFAVGLVSVGVDGCGSDDPLAAGGSDGGTASADVGGDPSDFPLGFVQLTYLKADPAQAGAEFGFDLALHGDTLAVGAPYQALGTAAEAGAVHVFVRTETGWELQALLRGSNTGEEDEFGQSVALDDDTLVVGAPHESSRATGVDGDQTDDTSGSSGAVYVFARSGETWTQQAYLKASNTGPTALFGFDVALHADTLAVGSPFEQSGATGIDGNQVDRSVDRAGAVYVFTRTGDAWAQEAYVKASNTRARSEFGGSVALFEDTLVVGASLENSAATGIDGDQADTSAEDAGAVYVFTRSVGTWSQQAYLKASNAAPDARFGFSAALDGDRLAVGAPFERGVPPSNGSGAVYTFTRTGDAWSEAAYLKANEVRSNAQLGRGAVALQDDVLVAGAQLDPSALAGAGAAHVFVRNGGTWSSPGVLMAGVPTRSAWFGQSIALSGDTLAIGAPRENSGASGPNGDPTNTSAPRSGAVYIFER